MVGATAGPSLSASPSAAPISSNLKFVAAGPLSVGYRDVGPLSGQPLILLHGFPYDIHAYDVVSEHLSRDGYRCLIPYLRGYGPTAFRSPQTMRSGQQAALGADLLAFLDALKIDRAIVAGYDWGGRAACIVAALWPERVSALVTCGSGYNIQNVASGGVPLSPDQEHRLWYQYYFQSERGRAGLAKDRRGFCRLLWRLWSPNWRFDDSTFDGTADAFDNPDFVDVVIHSYRARYRLVAGDPSLDAIESKLAATPTIRVPTIVVQGDADGVDPARPLGPAARLFSDLQGIRVLPGVGHNIPQEAPSEFAVAVQALRAIRAESSSNR